MKANLVLWVVALTLSLPLSSAVGASVLLSGFEGDLSTSLGPNWASNLTRSYVGTGVTQGASALQLSHGTGWTQDFFLDGGPALANLVASSDTFQIDTTTPASTSWRQLFVVMQGANQGWSQHQFDLAANATGTATLDLNATGIKANALAGDKGWWQIYLIFQGGDDPASNPIQTTLDNVRFNNSSVPEPASLVLFLVAGFGLSSVRRRS